MLKVFATQVVVSKGYDNTPALRFSENGDSVRFRIGKKVYDPHAENDSRWINLPVKAFNGVCERIKKMQLKEGSFVNILGRLDEDVWEDAATHERKSAMVVILDEIEYCAAGTRQQKEGTEPAGTQKAATAQPGAQASTSAPASAATSDNGGGGFTGYEPFGGANAFFDV